MDKTFRSAGNLVNAPVTVRAFGRKFDTVIDVATYHNGRPAIQLVTISDGEPFGTLTCNIPEYNLEENEILVKTWSENEEMAKCCLQSGFFKDTGKRVPTGFMEAQVWKILGG